MVSVSVQWIVLTGSIYDRCYASMDELAKERIITFSKHSRPHQDILNLLHAGNVAAPRISCVNSVAAMKRLIRDGFGIGALPAALVHEELKQGMVTILEDVPQPPPLDMVVTWRTGVGLELSEDIVALAGEVLQDYARQMGESMITLLPFASDQEMP